MIYAKPALFIKAKTKSSQKGNTLFVQQHTVITLQSDWRQMKP